MYVFFLLFLLSFTIAGAVVTPGSETEQVVITFTNKVFFGALRMVGFILDPICRFETKISRMIFGTN